MKGEEKSKGEERRGEERRGEGRRGEERRGEERRGEERRGEIPSIVDVRNYVFTLSVILRGRRRKLVLVSLVMGGVYVRERGR